MLEIDRIYEGDCLELMPEIEDKSIALVVTDPPYNVGLNYGENVNDSRDDYIEWLRRVWAEIRRVSKGVLITVGMVNFSTFCIEIEKPKWVCAWVKPNQCSRNNCGGFNVWEPILVYGDVGKIKQDCWNYPIKKQKGVGDHPCPKLLDMWEVLVNQAPAGGTVLDPFIGSGTTAIAALNTNRHFIGIEKEPKYVQIARQRISAMPKPLTAFTS